MRNVIRGLLAAAVMVGASSATNADQHAMAVDWSQVTEKTITITFFEADPNELVLRHGKPYRFHFINEGPKGFDNCIIADEFFAAINVAELKIRGKVVDNPNFEQIIIPPVKGAELSFVPIKTGVYEFHCNRVHQALFNMYGIISVTR